MDQVTVELVSSATDEVRELIGELEAELAQDYAPEQRHGLALEALFQPHIRFFIARSAGQAAGCGGVALFVDYAEVKRMYVRRNLRGRGIARTLLRRLEAEALAAGMTRLRLETGIHQPAAVRLYEAAGFRPCEVFGDYLALPPAALVTSLFFAKVLATPDTVRSSF